MQQDWKGLGRYGTVGLEFAGSILVGLFLGQLLDKKFETNGILTLVGFTYGLLAGGRFIYRALKRANKEAEEAEKKDRAEREKFKDADPKH